LIVTNIILNFKFKYIIGVGSWLVCKTAGGTMLYVLCTLRCASSYPGKL